MNIPDNNSITTDQAEFEKAMLAAMPGGHFHGSAAFQKDESGHYVGLETHLAFVAWRARGRAVAEVKPKTADFLLDGYVIRNKHGTAVLWLTNGVYESRAWCMLRFLQANCDLDLQLFKRSKGVETLAELPAPDAHWAERMEITIKLAED